MKMNLKHIVKKSIQRLKNWVMTCLTLPSRLYKKSKDKLGKIKKFIYSKLYKPKEAVKYVWIEYQLKRKMWILVKGLIDILVAGKIIHYSITNFNPLSCGLILFLVAYHLRLFMNFLTQKVKDVVGYIQRRD